jgi:integrase
MTRTYLTEQGRELFHAHGIPWDRLIEGRSHRTALAIGSDISLCVRWCEAEGIEPFPLPPEDLARYIGSMIDRGMKLTSVRRNIYSIGALHAVQGYSHPANETAWRPLWRSLIKRLEAAGAQGDVQAIPLTRHDFGQMVARCGTDLRGLRNKALLYVARDSLCKSFQLAALRFEDIYSGDDINGGYLRVPAVDASNAQGRFDYRPLSPATLGHIATWCERAGIDSGYLFPAIGGRRRADASPLSGGMGPQEIGRIIRRLAVSAGLDHAHTVTSESLRVGGVQHLMAQGATLDQIRQSAGWKTYRGIQRTAVWPPNVKPIPWGKLDDDM